MFDYIGDKIKGLAKVICWVGIIASVVIGIVIISGEVISGIITIVAGSILSWVGSFVLYGFGELVNSATKLAYLKEQEIKESKNKEQV